MSEGRLTNEGFTFADVLKFSRAYYKTKSGDDKAQRARLDVHSAKLTQRKNYDYDVEKKEWVQTGRDILFLFLVKSIPVSYKKTDTVPTHYYPVYVLIHDFNKGMNSTFRWRTSGLKKPIFGKKGDNKEQRTKIANKNIRQGCQMQFFFELEYVLARNNLLFGRCWANRPPKIANTRNKIFFDKHMYALVMRYLRHLFVNDRFVALVNKTYKLK